MHGGRGGAVCGRVGPGRCRAHRRALLRRVRPTTSTGCRSKAERPRRIDRRPKKHAPCRPKRNARASRSMRWAATTRRTRSSPARSSPSATAGSTWRWWGTKRGSARCLGDAAGSIEVVHVAGEIAMDMPATQAMRSARGTSLGEVVEMVRDGRADAALSAGNSGAFLAIALVRLRTIPGIARPAIAAVLPTVGGPFVLCDAGANVDCRPEWIAQFALMGDAYAQGRARHRAAARRHRLDRRRAQQGQPADARSRRAARRGAAALHRPRRRQGHLRTSCRRRRVRRLRRQRDPQDVGGRGAIHHHDAARDDRRRAADR